MFSSPGAIAFQIGPLVIRWYGILMATSIVVGLWLAYREAKRVDLPADDLVSACQWAVLAGLVGARAWEVVFNWDYYGRYPGKILAVWEGGLAIHGGLVIGPRSPQEHLYQADPVQNRKNIQTLLDQGVEKFYLGHSGPVLRKDVISAFALH